MAINSEAIIVRAKRLISKQSLPGWIVVVGNYLWKGFSWFIEWLGNLDTVREHTGGWTVSLTSLPHVSPYLLPLLGLAWLTLIVIWGDKLRFHKMLPELRPKIIPVQYGPSGDGHYGLFIRNEGELAFDVSIHAAAFGTARLDFWSELPNLGTHDGTKLLPAFIVLSSQHSLTGNGLRDEMIRQSVDTVPISIQYRDIDNQWFVTRCNLERDFQRGIRASFVSQETIAGRRPIQNSLPSGSAIESRPALAEEDPKVYLVPKNSEFRETGIIPFDLFNQGQRVNVAHRIAVQPIPKVPSVSFEYVNHLEMNQHKELLPILGDVNVFQTHNILPVLERAWTEECKATGEAKDEFPFEITIFYEDVSGKRKFETKVSLVYSPGTQVVAGLEAMALPHRERQIIEVVGMDVKRLS